MASRTAAAPELAARLAPGYRPGCRRLTPGDGYLEALQQANCRDDWTRITRATARGLVTTTTTTTGGGDDEEKEEAFDAIVCATGFDSSWFPQWRMVGRGGATLEEQWRDDPVAFFATMVDGFPNYGMVNGPNAVISHGSVLAQMDWTIDFLLKWVMRMNRQDIRYVWWPFPPPLCPHAPLFCSATFRPFPLSHHRTPFLLSSFPLTVKSLQAPGTYFSSSIPLTQ